MKDGQTIGQWLKWDFEANGVLKIQNGFWVKREYYSDSQGNQIYYESSNGTIIDNRIPEVIEHNGHKYQLIR